jgi:glycosyltransferase involved in cell wall biosynthesis
MRRLLQAMAGARHGGAEMFFVRLATALQRAGETQRVLIRRDPERSQRLREAGVDVGELAFGGRLDLATRCRFRREIAAWQPTVVLTWMNRATHTCPCGEFVHVARLGGYYDLKYYRAADHLIANTRAIAAYAEREGWPAERVHYLPNFVPDAGAPAERRAGKAAAPRLLAVGRLHQNKGFAVLLEALAITSELRLDIAGDGPLRQPLERLAQQLGVADRVAFLGWRDDVPALLARADIFVCPSLREPLGNVVIEAWAAGRPVIATASDGPVALISHEISGLLVPLPGQPGGGAPALADAIERLAGDPALRGSLAAGGRRAYEAEFTETAVVQCYCEFLDRVAPA